MNTHTHTHTEERHSRHEALHSHKRFGFLNQLRVHVGVMIENLPETQNTTVTLISEVK